VIALSLDELASFISYDPHSGQFAWLQDVYRVRKVYSNSKTGVKGVIYVTGRTMPWRAQVRKNGKNIIVGNYPSIEEAAEAYKRAASIHHGEYAHV
jgi:hypothetical protein